jgi:acetyltransferase
VTHDLLARFTQIDYDREIAIIAEVEEKGEKKMAGVVRLVSDPVTETAEFAIVVADPWQGNGLGNYLTDYGLKLAREKGIKTILASFLNANTRMRHMFEARGFTVTKNDFESSSAELKLEKVEV